MLRNDVKMMMNKEYMFYYRLVRQYKKDRYLKNRCVNLSTYFEKWCDGVVITLCYVNEMRLSDFIKIQEYRRFLTKRLDDRIHLYD